VKKDKNIILTNTERKQETVKIICLLNQLSLEEQEKIFAFVQGILFAKNYATEKEIKQIVEQFSS